MRITATFQPQRRRDRQHPGKQEASKPLSSLPTCPWDDAPQSPNPMIPTFRTLASAQMADISRRHMTVSNRFNHQRLSRPRRQRQRRSRSFHSRLRRHHPDPRHPAPRWQRQRRQRAPREDLLRQMDPRRHLCVHPARVQIQARNAPRSRDPGEAGPVPRIPSLVEKTGPRPAAPARH